MSGTPWSLAIHFDTRHKSTVKPAGGIKDKMPSAVSVHVWCTCLQMLLSSSFIVLVSGFLFYLLVIFLLGVTTGCWARPRYASHATTSIYFNDVGGIGRGGAGAALSRSCWALQDLLGQVNQSLSTQMVWWVRSWSTLARTNHVSSVNLSPHLSLGLRNEQWHTWLSVLRV